MVTLAEAVVLLNPLCDDLDSAQCGQTILEAEERVKKLVGSDNPVFEMGADGEYITEARAFVDKNRKKVKKIMWVDRTIKTTITTPLCPECDSDMDPEGDAFKCTKCGHVYVKP